MMVKIPKLRWLIAGMLFFSTLINYTARLTLSVVVGNVLREFTMTEKDYAQIVSLFLVAYAVMYAGSGYVVDRLGTRRGFALFVSAWSAAQVLTGFARGEVVTGGHPIRPGARRTRQLSGGSQDRPRVVPSPPARGGGRIIQRRVVNGRGSGRTGGRLPDRYVTAGGRRFSLPALSVLSGWICG